MRTRRENGVVVPQSTGAEIIPIKGQCTMSADEAKARRALASLHEEIRCALHEADRRGEAVLRIGLCKDAGRALCNALDEFEKGKSLDEAFHLTRRPGNPGGLRKTIDWLNKQRRYRHIKKHKAERPGDQWERIFRAMPPELARNRIGPEALRKEFNRTTAERERLWQEGMIRRAIKAMRALAKRRPIKKVPPTDN